MTMPVDIFDDIPTFAAPAKGCLTEEMVAGFHKAGVLVLRDFVPVAACRELQQRANELVEGFDPAEVRSVFSTTRQTQLDDSYFIDSGDKIRFFLEDDALNEAGELR